MGDFMRNNHRITKAVRHPVLSAAVLAVMLAGPPAVTLGQGNDDGDYVKLASQGFFFVNGRYFTDPGVELTGPGATGTGGGREAGPHKVEDQGPPAAESPSPPAGGHRGAARVGVINWP